MTGTEGIGHDGGTAGAEHESHGGNDHEKGHNQIDGFEGDIPREIGDEQPVHHAVDGSEYHHKDGRQGERQ